MNEDWKTVGWQFKHVKSATPGKNFQRPSPHFGGRHSRWNTSGSPRPACWCPQPWPPWACPWTTVSRTQRPPPIAGPLNSPPCLRRRCPPSASITPARSCRRSSAPEILIAYWALWVLRALKIGRMPRVFLATRLRDCSHTISRKFPFFFSTNFNPGGLRTQGNTIKEHLTFWIILH